MQAVNSHAIARKCNGQVEIFSDNVAQLEETTMANVCKLLLLCSIAMALMATAFGEPFTLFCNMEEPDTDEDPFIDSRCQYHGHGCYR